MTLFPGFHWAAYLLGHSAFALEMALLPHLDGLFEPSAWYEGSTSTTMVKEI